MHTFKDNAGRVWAVEINVSQVKRLRGLLNLDLYSLVDDSFKGLDELLGDPVRLVDALYCLCQAQADKLGVADEDFGRALGGDSLGAAADALLQELIDFFPKPGAREALKQVVAKGRRVTELALAQAEGKLAQLDPQEMADRLIASFGGPPASSDSTPDPSPSASS